MTLSGSSAPGSARELTYLVAGMSCGHCKVAVTDEVSRVAGVDAVDVDLDSKLVRVHGTDVDAAAVVAAIDEAGYDAVVP
jgi:copper chaperone